MSSKLVDDVTPQHFGVGAEYSEEAQRYAEYCVSMATSPKDKLSERIEYLRSGKALMMEHALYGKYRFSMNPQKNRLFAEPMCNISKAFEKSTHIVTREGMCYRSSNSIQACPENFLFWGSGEWYLETKEPSRGYVWVETEGEYEKI